MSEEVRKPLTLIFTDSAPDKLHMGLMVAATASATGRKVHLFFSKRSAILLTEGGTEAILQMAGIDPGTLQDEYEEKGIADFSILLDALASMNAEFSVCETALVEHDIHAEQLMTRPQVHITGIATMLDEGAGGDFLTF